MDEQDEDDWKIFPFREKGEPADGWFGRFAEMLKLEAIDLDK
jgi:hypothetical protein